MRIKDIVAPTLLAILIAALLVQLPLAIADRSSTYEWFDPIVEIRQTLVDRFVESPDVEQMRTAIIQAMVETVDDPYTVYIPPANTEEFNKDLRGEYVGIGAEVNIVDKYLTIVSPMDDSPALAAGVRAGDTVLEIEGVTTFEKPITECIDLLMGEPSTPVEVRVRHLDGVEEDLTIERQHIVTHTVKGLRRLGEEWTYCLDEANQLAYIRVTQFTGSTIEDLRPVVMQLVEDGLDGLVLDLRDNPGGSLAAAVEMSDLFLSEGVIVSVRGRDAARERTYNARPEGTLPDFPMVVLINGNSASASEIVSGALQENGRARVLGTRSFGKGSVQEVRELEFDRGTLKFTSAHYYLPSGRNIQKRPGALEWGVDPDDGYVVPVTDADYVSKLQARRDLEIIRDPEAEAQECGVPTWIREALLDEQLAVATEALLEKRSTGAWPMPGEAEAAQIAMSDDLRRAAERRSWLLQQLGNVEERIRELQAGADELGSESMLPHGADLLDGVITIADQEGEVVGTYRVRGGNLGLALQGLQLEAVEDEP